jgi:hypothetical protein
MGMAFHSASANVNVFYINFENIIISEIYVASKSKPSGENGWSRKKSASLRTPRLTFCACGAKALA